MQKMTSVLFALVRSAIKGEKLKEEERALYDEGLLPPLMALAKKHDITPILVVGLLENELLKKGSEQEKKALQARMQAVYRYEQIHYELEELCGALEEAKLAFIPLKGSILREYYPEPWMRTSCDIDVLVREEDVEKAISYLVEHKDYTRGERTPHDVTVLTPTGLHIELHYDLVEEGRANQANEVLKLAWKNSIPANGCIYRHELSEEFFYFYHIAHMAKHFESGGCGIRPFVDLYILNERFCSTKQKQNELLQRGSLLKFATAACALSDVWFDKKSADQLSLKMESYIVGGGVYGSSKNRVAVQQKNKGGKIGYIFSRIFAPYSKLKRYYPILEKHKWLTPFMQVRRWFMLLNPRVARMAKNELAANQNLDKKVAKEMNEFLEQIGL